MYKIIDIGARARASPLGQMEQPYDPREPGQYAYQLQVDNLPNSPEKRYGVVVFRPLGTPPSPQVLPAPRFLCSCVFH